MPFPEAPTVLMGDICEVTIWGTLCGQRVLNVLHYQAGNDSAPALDVAMQDLLDELQNIGKLKDKFLAAAAQNYDMNEIVAQIIHPVRWARFPSPVGEPGAIADDALTADLAAVIEKSGFFAASNRAAKLGLGKTGGLHFAPVPAEKMSEGILDQVYLETELNDLGAEVVNIVTTASMEWIPGIFSATADPKVFTATNRHSEKNTVRVMRRRTVGVGI